MTEQSEAQPQPNAKPRGALARLLEWVLRSEAIERAGRAADRLGPGQRIRHAHARSAATIADALADTNRPRLVGSEQIDCGSQRGAAISLYREAAFWALAADNDGALPASLADALERGRPMVARHASLADVDGARAALLDRTFRETADLSAAALAEDQRAGQAFVHALLSELERRDNPGGRLRAQRWRRIGAVALAVLLGLTGLYAGARAVEEAQHPDRAAGARWRASSHLEGYANEGTGFDVKGAGHVFLHTTQEESPWVDFDLGTSRPVYRVVVNNRADCCADRATPLLVELSDDDVHWTVVAQQLDQFTSWDARFRAQPARHVRLRVGRASMLHLESVEIH